MLVSIVVIAFGMNVVNNGIYRFQFSYTDSYTGNYSGSSADYASLGADFYTYTYKGIRIVVGNVNALGEVVEDVGYLVNASTHNLIAMANKVVGYGLIVTGALALAASLYGFGAALESARMVKLLKVIAANNSSSALPVKSDLHTSEEKDKTADEPVLSVVFAQDKAE